MSRRYLVILDVGRATHERLALIGAGVRSTLDSAALGPVELLFRSTMSDHFGFLLRTDSSSAQIVNSLTSPDDEPFLDNNDKVIVFEVGEDVSTTVAGYGRVRAWLQRH